MAKDKAKSKKTPEVDSDIPEGFTPLGRKNVDGWFVREAGNMLQGTLRDSFTVKSKQPRFPDKKVYVVDITAGETRIMDGEGNPQSVSEGTIGIDETGYLKKLSDLEKGTEIFIKCKGKESDKRDAPWIFVVAANGVVPF